MAQKPTTGSQSPSSSKVPEVPKFDPLESEMPHLDDNDVWFYQIQMEGLIRRNVPDSMNGRSLYMLRVLGAQARRVNRKDEL